LGIDDTNVAGFFNSLKDGLNAPLKGMSIAFSSSLLGLGGSLILGYADLNLGQAQNKFTQFLEKILHNNSLPDFINSSSSTEYLTLTAMQKIYDNLDSLVYTLKETTQHQNQMFSYMQSLAEQMKELNSNTREQEKKLSNFISAQLNTQSNILELSNNLNKEGILDKKTKKNFENIDKGIQSILSQLKKQ
jgi:hypothetical protein